MQRARDTFYVAIRDGIAAVNPQRTVAVRGVLRPGVLVEENELPMAIALADVFRLHWMTVETDRSSTVPLVKLRCEVSYETAGSAAGGGLDRGRMLTAMDEELLAVLEGETQYAPQMDFSTGAAIPDGTRIFWSDPTWAGIERRGERIGRTITLDVWGLERTDQA